MSVEVCFSVAAFARLSFDTAQLSAVLSSTRLEAL